MGFAHYFGDRNEKHKNLIIIFIIVQMKEITNLFYIMNFLGAKNFPTKLKIMGQYSKQHDLYSKFVLQCYICKIVYIVKEVIERVFNCQIFFCVLQFKFYCIHKQNQVIIWLLSTIMLHQLRYTILYKFGIVFT
jgi:hypothetical protein